MRSVDFWEETGGTRPKGSSFGFTLIELLLVIIIMSAITMAVAYSAQRAIDKVNFENAQQMAKNIDTALEYFRLKAMRLPCPAQRGVAQSAANYGREDCAWSDTNSVSSNRTLTSYPVSVSATDNKVYIGNLPIYVQETAGGPWVSLASYVPALDKVGSAKFLDATGNPPLYAVAKKLTAASGASGGDFGNIQIVDENDNPVAGVNNDARYVVVLQTYRGGGCVVGNKDHENCDLSNDKFVIAPRALNTASASYFDDVVLFGNQITDQRWLSNETSLITSPIDSSTQTRGLVYADDNARNIGVGTTRPTEKLEVVGGLRAETNVRAPLLCDPPNVVVQTNSANQTINFNFAVDSADIVVKKISGGTTTTLTLTTDYTIAGSSGAWIINLVAPPALTDTIRVEKWTCLDPLTVTRDLDVSGAFISSPDGALRCPAAHDPNALPEFSTSSMIASASTSPWIVPGMGEGLVASGFPDYRMTAYSRMRLAPPDSTSGGFWRLIYFKSSFGKPYGWYGLDTPGQTIVLMQDTGNTYSGLSGYGSWPYIQPEDLRPENQRAYIIRGTKARYRYEQGLLPCGASGCSNISATCTFSVVGGTCTQTGTCTPAELDRQAKIQAAGPACKGFHLGLNCGDASVSICPFNSEMHTILLEPLGAGSPVAQNSSSRVVNIKIVRIGQYLKGVTVDNNGMMKPVCGNLDIKPPTAATNCGSHQLRGVWTKETVVSGVSQGVGICN